MVASYVLRQMYRAAEKAARGLIRDFGELGNLHLSRKSDGTFAIKSEINVENRIINELDNKEYQFISRNTSNSATELKDCWTLDPLDGVANFIRGIPYFAINIAAKIDGEFLDGLIYDPLRGESYEAEKNSGAFLNGRTRIRVSGNERLEKSIIAVTMASSDTESKLIESGALIRKTGSISLDVAYMASGKYDAVIVKDAYIWNIASGMVLIRESGGFFELHQKANKKFDLVAASSKKLLNNILSKL
ncbi:MAG: hypothetical protein IJ481_03140 [Alphaproteobacteria bacterium]|nr:hypothetical protein [Alphaproteobacteria bacterium]